MRKLFQGLSGGAWGVLIGKWMRERASVLEVEETANVVFAFSEEAGSGEPNPGLRQDWSFCSKSNQANISTAARKLRTGRFRNFNIKMTTSRCCRAGTDKSAATWWFLFDQERRVFCYYQYIWCTNYFKRILLYCYLLNFCLYIINDLIMNT